MGLATAAVLIYEVAITRLLSVVLWYHFAFLSISVAMLGLGASGVWYSLRPPTPRSLPRVLLAAGVTIPLSVFVILKARPLVTTLGLGTPGWIATIVVAMLVPMYSAGSAVCLLLMSAEGRSVGRMYGADLMGATLGAALVVPLMWRVPTPELLALTGLLPLAALALVGGLRRPIWIASAATIPLLAYWGVPFEVAYSKIHSEQGSYEPIHEVWTPTARITVYDRPIFSPNPDVPWGWGYGTGFTPEAARGGRQMWIDQDGSAGTPIENLRGDPRELRHLLFDVTSFGYQLFSPRKVCIIGTGGGRDVLTALSSGAESVDAVELNQGIVDLLRGPLADYSGDVYERPGVHAIVSEGRSFLTRTTERYDLVQISLVDSWAATAAGAFALSENYLYTVEALRLYMSRLADDGVLSISRWTDYVQPLEGARLILLAEEALRREGAAAPRDHLLFLTAGSVGTLIVSKEPLGGEAIRSADRIAEERGFERVWPIPEGNAPGSLVALVLQRGTAQLAAAGLDLSPPVDDRPFFFQAASLFGLGDEAKQLLPRDMNLQSTRILRIAVLVLGLVALALFFLPFAVFSGPERGPGLWMGSAYFAFIGAAFMLVEIPWIQKSILFLGHPSYAAAVVLSSLLLGAGLGSTATSRLAPSTARRLMALLPLATLAVTIGMSPLFETALAQPLLVRALLDALLCGAAGLLMGLAIPTGFVTFGDERKAWFWAVNGAAGVFASALSVGCAMTFGFLVTALLGAILYLAAFATLQMHGPPRQP